MLRPPRRKGRFQGSGEATTSLSNPYAADGRRMRRRYACYAALCLVVLCGCIALIVKKSGGDDNVVTSQSAAGSYTKLAEATISDIAGKVTTYTHKNSGMSVLTIVPDDTTQDAVFGINFRTLPEDDTGAPYIVQNAIQSGSTNFPIKDPFNQLERGSLQTFMDTWVEKDRSCYVYASRNKADFKNGVKVFLDGVFEPIFLTGNHSWIFRQEAWRLYTDGTDVRLGGNGISHSKARQMEPNTAHENFVYKAIFDGHPYSFMEKGDWRQMVTFSPAAMNAYYTKYYHPSNGQAFCFGPQDYVDECLNLMAPYLSKYNADASKSAASKVGWIELDEIDSVTQSFAYPSYKGSTDYRLGISFVLNDQPMDSRVQMAWHVIYELLMGGPSAIIPRVVVDNSLGDDAFGYLASHLHQWMLTVGVTGVGSEEAIEVARTAINDRFVEIASGGFDEAAVTAALNKLSMQFREMSSENEPRGVQLFKQVLPTWNYGGDPKSALLHATAFAELKAEIESDGQGILLQLFQSKIVDNQHRLISEMHPSSDLATQYAQDEQSWLDKSDSWLTKDQGLALIAESQALQKVQETPDSQAELDKISSLSISDLRTVNYEIEKEIVTDVFDSGITMLAHEVPSSNGIVYIDFSVDISNMDFDDVVLLPLLCQLLLQAGSTTMNGIKMQRMIDTHTGGITVEPIVEEIVSTGSDNGYLVPTGEFMVTKIVVRTSCLAETGCVEMFTLVKNVLFDSDIEQQAKAIEILKKKIDDMEDDVQVNAYKYTTLRIQSQYGLPGFIREQWQGISQLINLRRSYVQAESAWADFSNRLVLMADAFRKGNRNGMTLCLTGDKSSMTQMAYGLEIFLKDTLPTASQTTRFPDFATTQHPWYTTGMKKMSDEISAEGENEAFIAPTRVNAVAKGGRLFEVGEAIRGYDLVVLQFISGFFLYDELRFGQGASEAWAVIDIDTGSVVYQSDEDPNIMETLDIYEEGASWVERQVSGYSSLPVEAKGAVIGTIGAMDGTALQPSHIGFTSLVQYLKQETAATRQQFRKEILATIVSDFHDFVTLLGSWGQPSIAVVTNEAQYADAVASGLQISKCDITSQSC